MIDTAYLDSIGDNWMIRMDVDGAGSGGFIWQPLGEWTECPIWSDSTGADCMSGGLFGQGPGGVGDIKPGNRIVFCETGPERISFGGKVKVRRARIIHVGADAIAALRHVTADNFRGGLDLSGCTLPEGLTLPQTVGGGLYLSGCKMAGCKAESEIRAKLEGQ